MSTSTLHPAAAAYLRQVRREGRDLPSDRRAELLIDLEEHLSAAIPAEASEQEAREVLARFGHPHEIIEAERPQVIVSAQRRGTREWAAIFLVLFGFFVAGVGWLVGVVLLWSSRAWTTKDKLIGTLVLPGGLFTSVVLVLLATARAHKQMCLYRGASLVHCTHVPTSGPSTVGSIGLILLALTPIATGVYLTRRAR